MIDELVWAVMDPIVEAVPDVVWGALIVFAGMAAILTGAFVVEESARVGAALIGGGVLAVGGVLVSWRR
ncbi:hypothetical protein [Halobaculum lipolyticum]|uniref:Uncharacterized protein n=1 Tax=Halobaculum lipolyticum TaxID=3032001 RepID=A0ABD5W9G1_9EURY|nr:hypothetical protein [Halobaculum sp. DT31]